MYKIGQVAEIANVSMKLLRYYDEIGLLVAKKDEFSKIRYYSYQDLIKLQQILFYRKLRFKISDILKIYQNSEMSPLKILKEQRDLFYNEIKQTEILINTIEKTIFTLENNMENILMISDEELYEGFTPEKIQEYRSEATQRWGSKVQESETRIKKLGKDGWRALKQKGDLINKNLAELMDKYPEHPDVQDQIILWHDYIENFYDCSPEMLLELGRMYSQDLRFKENYDKYRINLAPFITKAIEYYYSNKIYLKRKKV